MDETKSIQSILVVGGGVMGWQITLMLSQKRKAMTIYDIDSKRFPWIREQIQKNLQRRIEKGKIDKEKASKIQESIKYEANLETAVLDKDLVIECIPENIDLKRSVFKQLQKSANENTIFASNSSSFEITYILEDPRFSKSFKQQCANLHFFNPVFTLKLVEIFSPNQTVVKRLKSFIRKIAYEPVVLLKPTPAFIANRILAGVFREVFELLNSGACTPEDIDTACTAGLKWPLGAARLADFVGLDTIYHALLDGYQRVKQEYYKPNPYLEDKIKKGHFGYKSKKGIYDYQ
jgi:3-hydroxybutyryl-CoA dehydrogenase